MCAYTQYAVRGSELHVDTVRHSRGASWTEALNSYAERSLRTTSDRLLSSTPFLAQPHYPLPQMFSIQFDAAGIYLVGTTAEQFHVPFEELISFAGGIIGLLEYGLSWKVYWAEHGIDYGIDR
ncbi:uncharacterized protein N7498_008360 [Penicillium cinerascens]|uniref:Uncharacterized protein n=1 Tax=Penicillium cinerascens TaxID=70096 RepID=A0A9W9JFA1_9EURO|nr:uncharacterized protein N7498_008360 [Penicillium cinerascens]KAJ5194922.1 hypothetical protein N7498_008360 [Penicillium cinerascens]